MFWFTPTLRVWTPPMLSRFGSFNCGEEERLLTVNFLASLAVGVVVAIASHSDPFPSSIKRAMPKKGAQMKGRAEIDRTLNPSMCRGRKIMKRLIYGGKK